MVLDGLLVGGGRVDPRLLAAAVGGLLPPHAPCVFTRQRKDTGGRGQPKTKCSPPDRHSCGHSWVFGVSLRFCLAQGTLSCLTVPRARFPEAAPLQLLVLTLFLPGCFLMGPWVLDLMVFRVETPRLRSPRGVTEAVLERMRACMCSLAPPPGAVTLAPGW